MSTTVAQRDAALLKANKIRFSRARMKEDFRKRRRDPARTLRRPPYYVKSMTLHAFLSSIPDVAKAKARRVLVHHRLTGTETLGELSRRDREAVATTIEERKWAR